MYCSNCGNEITEGQNFCNKCGNKLIKENSISNNNMKLNEAKPDNKILENTIETNNNVNTNSTNNNVFTVLFGNIILITIIILFIWGAWKLFQPILFPTNLQKNGYNAEYHAQLYLDNYCKANELKVKAIEEKNGIYIVKCTTTNEYLINKYGSIFYYGYMPSASGLKYYQYADTSKQKVYDRLNK